MTWKTGALSLCHLLQHNCLEGRYHPGASDFWRLLFLVCFCFLFPEFSCFDVAGLLFFAFLGWHLWPLVVFCFCFSWFCWCSAVFLAQLGESLPLGWFLRAGAKKTAKRWGADVVLSWGRNCSKENVCFFFFLGRLFWKCLVYLTASLPSFRGLFFCGFLRASFVLDKPSIDITRSSPSFRKDRTFVDHERPWTLAFLLHGVWSSYG